MNLSPRQREIVTMVGRDGASYKRVASALGISVATVRTHIARIVEKSDLDRSARSVLVYVYWTELAE